MAWIQERVQHGMTVVDIGANAGGYVKSFLAAGAQVWAIEPDPRCRAALLEYLQPERIIDAAVSDHEGRGTLHRSRHTSHNSLTEANLLDPTPDVPAIEVEYTTLDALRRDGRIPAQIDVLKIDAQGAELAILRGARQLLLTLQQPWIYMELWPMGLEQAGASVDALLTLCEDHGYVPVGGDYAYWRHHVKSVTGHGAYDVLLRPAHVAVAA